MAYMYAWCLASEHQASRPLHSILATIENRKVENSKKKIMKVKHREIKSKKEYRRGNVAPLGKEKMI